MDGGGTKAVIARSAATTQSSPALDCFALLAMTDEGVSCHA
jgi:hypothetical protein